MRACSRTLDKPVLLFGLEVEDVGILSLVVGIGSLFLGPLIPGIVGLLGWISLILLKKDKPAGYVIHWLYHQGVEFPGLIKPIKYQHMYSLCPPLKRVVQRL